MHAADRPEFEPPKEPGLLRAFALAVLAHLLLVLALMHGLQWKRESQMAAAEAELWSALPQEAAPKEVPQPPPPPPPPVVKAPPPPPAVKAPEPPAKREADIAIEREKQKREVEKKKQAELERERDERRKLEAQKKKREEELAKRREEELAKKKREEELAKKREAEQEKKEQQAKLAEAKRKEDEKKRKQQEEREERDAKKLAELRQENLKRMQGMAGGTGSPTSTGSSARSSGPSASWGSKVQARVRPNIVFTDPVSGNPKAEVEVRTSPDGTIVGKRLVRSSGVSSWDEAVLRALEKTESLPRDVDGRVPSPVVIEFRPKG